MRKMSKFALKKVAFITTDLYYAILEEQNFFKKRENRPKLLKNSVYLLNNAAFRTFGPISRKYEICHFAIFGRTTLLSVLIGTIKPRYTFNLIFHLFCLIFSVRDSAYAPSCVRCLSLHSKKSLLSLQISTTRFKSNRIFLKNVKNAADWPKIVFYCRKTPILGDLDRFRENTEFAIFVIFGKTTL